MRLVVCLQTPKVFLNGEGLLLLTIESTQGKKYQGG